MALSPDQKAEIDRQREKRSHTRRVTVPAIEEMLGEVIPVLDHGFIRVVDYMGDDTAIVQAARVSYGTGTKQTSNDEGLIRYLMRHHHSTPFEMCEIKLHVKLPIFVARQWVRHRTANINEYSARYSILDKEFYVPDAAFLEAKKTEDKVKKKEEEEERSGQMNILLVKDFLNAVINLDAEVQDTAAQSTLNKQGRESVLSKDEAREVLEEISRESSRAYTIYRKLLNEKGDEKYRGDRIGIARELARIVLPTNYYTQWYWKTDLHNLFHFIALRADSHAQKEIRAYAERISEITHRWVPIAWQAFEDYRKGGAHLSASGLAVVKRLVSGEAVTREGSGMSKREWRELMQTLGRKE